jgi:hypothetical protein
MFAINEKAILQPEQVEVTVLGTVVGQALVKGKLGTMQVPFRRLQKLEEAAEIKEICDVAEECAEIAGATVPPVPETVTVASTEGLIPSPPERPSLEEQPDAPMEAPKTSFDTGEPGDLALVEITPTEDPKEPTLSVEKLPKRITKKWLNDQPVQILQEILEKADLTTSRRKTIKAHLEARKD